jgi:rhodanese-related sulfurtransferase
MKSMTINFISPLEAFSQRETALILDVRNPDEYQISSVEASVLHPLGLLDADAVAKIRREGEPCFVLCAAGMRARKAAGMLCAAGHKDVAVIEGGIMAWMDAGLPVNQGATL